MEYRLERAPVRVDEPAALVDPLALLLVELCPPIDPPPQDVVRRIQPHDRAELFNPDLKHVFPPRLERRRGRERLPLSLQSNERVDRALIEHRDAAAAMDLTMKHGPPSR